MTDFRQFVLCTVVLEQQCLRRPDGRARLVQNNVGILALASKWQLIGRTSIEGPRRFTGLEGFVFSRGASVRRNTQAREGSPEITAARGTGPHAPHRTRRTASSRSMQDDARREQRHRLSNSALRLGRLRDDHGMPAARIHRLALGERARGEARRSAAIVCFARTRRIRDVKRRGQGNRSAERSVASRGRRTRRRSSLWAR